MTMFRALSLFKQLTLISDLHELEEPQKLISIMTNLDNTAAKFIRDCFELSELKIKDYNRSGVHLCAFSRVE